MGLGAIIGGLFVSHQTVVNTPDYTPSFGAYSPTGGSTYRLGQSVGTSDTTIRLSSFKEPVSNIPYTMTYLNSDIEYGTLSPQSSVSEFISFSGISQNSDGSATLTGVTRGLSRTPGTGGCVASSTLAQPHAGQSIFILSNPPCQIAEYPGKRNTEYITGAWGFQVVAPTSTVCATAFELCNKGYVDATANAGAATSTETNGGIVELGTLAEQASSFDGGLNKPTVLQTKNSTSTCQVAGFYNIVASSTTGKLAASCFDQTYRYNFTGTTTLATSTIASTTIQNALNVPGTATFQGTVNGISGKLYLNTAPTTDTGTASTTIFQFALPANTLSTANIVHMHANIHGMGVDQAVCAAYLATSFGGVSTSTLKLDVASQTLRGPGQLDIYVVGTGATNSQKMTTTLLVSATSTAAAEGGGSVSKSIAIDSTIPQNITLEYFQGATGGACFFEPDLVVGELIK